MLSLAAIIVSDIFLLSFTSLSVCVVVGVCSAMTGLFTFKYLHANRYLHPKTILLWCICVLTVLVGGIFLVTQPNASWALVIFSGVGGFHVSCIGAFARSIVSRLAPTHTQTRMFALYQFSQESTSWIGPLLIATIATSVGGENVSFLHVTLYVVLAELCVGIPLLWWVNVERGEGRREERDGFLRKELGIAVSASP